MPTCTVTLSANAGMAIQLGRARLWFDAMHQDKVPGFSTVSPALMAALEQTPAFFDPDLILCSHCHADHFSLPLLKAAQGLWPRATIALPEPVLPGQVLLEGPEVSLTAADVHVRLGRLTHDGERYRDVPHYGCILRCEDFRVLLAGDCAVANPELEALIGGEAIDLAVLNFPWLTLPKGRAFIETVIRPKHLLLCHLPFQPDDRWGYRLAAQRSLGRLSAVPDIRLLAEPLQQETFD